MREQRTRIVFLLSVIVWAVFVLVIVASAFSQPEVQPPETPEPPEQTNEVVAVPTHSQPTEPTPPPDTSVEPEPTESSPVREDIPLDTETQMLLYQACEETGVSYELAVSVIWKETRFRNIPGDNGNSVGYMQVQERWHKDRMERWGVTDLTDPYGNFLVGCDYLAEMLEKGRGIEWALHAYNGGPSYANQMAEAKKVSQYVTDVLNYMNNLGGN